MDYSPWACKESGTAKGLTPTHSLFAIIHFEKLFEILEDRKSSVLKAIDASKKLRLDKFQTQMEEYQGLLENNGLVGYAQEVLKETDQSCFVQTAKQLHVRYFDLN